MKNRSLSSATLGIFVMLLLFAAVPKLVGIISGTFEVSNGLSAALAAAFGLITVGLRRASFDKCVLRVALPLLCSLGVIAFSIAINGVLGQFSIDYLATSIVSHVLLPFIAVLIAAAMPKWDGAIGRRGSDLLGLSDRSVLVILFFLASVSMAEVAFIRYEDAVAVALRERGFLSWSGFFRIGDTALTRGFGVFQVPAISGFIGILLAALSMAFSPSMRFVAIVFAFAAVCATLTRNVFLFAVIAIGFYACVPRGLAVVRLLQVVSVIALIWVFVLLILQKGPAAEGSLLSTGSTEVRMASWLRIFGYVFSTGSFLKYLFGFGITQVGEGNPLNLLETYDFAIDNAYVLVFLCGGLFALLGFAWFYVTMQRELHSRWLVDRRKSSGIRALSALWAALPLVAMFNGMIGMFQFFPLLLLVSLRAIRTG